MNDLLNCPFCGEKANITQFFNYNWSVFCTNVDCGAIMTRQNKKDAISAWNTRAERTCHVGKSEFVGDMYAFEHEFHCDCGLDTLFTTDQQPPNYCPNCGAKVE